MKYYIIIIISTLIILSTDIISKITENIIKITLSSDININKINGNIIKNLNIEKIDIKNKNHIIKIETANLNIKIKNTKNIKIKNISINNFEYINKISKKKKIIKKIYANINISKKNIKINIKKIIGKINKKEINSSLLLIIKKKELFFENKEMTIGFLHIKIKRNIKKKNYIINTTNKNKIIKNIKANIKYIKINNQKISNEFILIRKLETKETKIKNTISIKKDKKKETKIDINLNKINLKKRYINNIKIQYTKNKKNYNIYVKSKPKKIKLKLNNNKKKIEKIINKLKHINIKVIKPIKIKIFKKKTKLSKIFFKKNKNNIAMKTSINTNNNKAFCNNYLYILNIKMKEEDIINRYPYNMLIKSKLYKNINKILISTKNIIK